MLDISPVSLDTPKAQVSETHRNSEQSSFESRLEEAEKKLAEDYARETIIPWESAQAMLQSLLIDFSSNLKIESVSFQPSTQSQNYLSNLSDSSSSASPAAGQNASQSFSANAAGEENKKTNEQTLEQTTFKINLAGNPFFVAAMWDAGFSKMAASKIDLELIISKIINQAKLLKNGEKQTLELSFASADLGNLLLSVSKNEGKLNIQIFAAEEVKKRLEENISALEESLKNANINIGSLAVSIGKKKEDQGERKSEAVENFGLSNFPEIFESAGVAVSVDTKLLKRFMAWLPKLNVDFSV